MGSWGHSAVRLPATLVLADRSAYAVPLLSCGRAPRSWQERSRRSPRSSHACADYANVHRLDAVDHGARCDCGTRGLPAPFAFIVSIIELVADFAPYILLDSVLNRLRHGRD